MGRVSIHQLDYKAPLVWQNLVKIDKWYPSSKRCFDCGHILILRISCACLDLPGMWGGP